MGKWITPRDGLNTIWRGKIDLPMYPDTLAVLRGCLLSMTRLASWEQIPDVTISVEDAVVVGETIFDSLKRRAMIAMFAEKRAYNVAGGDAGANTWQVRQLNTQEYISDLFSEVTPDLDNFRVYLAPGLYRVRAAAAACYVARTMVRLVLSADGAPTTYIYGRSTWDNQTSPNSAVVWPSIDAILDLAGGRFVQLSHYTQIASATNGLGVNTNINGVDNTYATLEVELL